MRRHARIARPARAIFNVMVFMNTFYVLDILPGPARACLAPRGQDLLDLEAAPARPKPWGAGTRPPPPRTGGITPGCRPGAGGNPRRLGGWRETIPPSNAIRHRRSKHPTVASLYSPLEPRNARLPVGMLFSNHTGRRALRDAMAVRTISASTSPPHAFQGCFLRPDRHARRVRARRERVRKLRGRW